MVGHESTDDGSVGVFFKATFGPFPSYNVRQVIDGSCDVRRWWRVGYGKYRL